MNEKIFDEVASVPLVVADAAQARMERLVRWLIAFAVGEALMIAAVAAAVMI